MGTAATLIKTTGADGSAAAAPSQTTVVRKSQAVRATNGTLIEIPFNSFELFDTQALAERMSFFPRQVGGDLTRSNYDANPPNSAEPTIITHLGLETTVFSIESYEGGGTAANAVKPTAILNALRAGTLAVVKNGTRERLVETPISRFFDFSRADIKRDGANIIATLPSSSQLTALDEAVYVEPGVGYTIDLTFRSGAAFPVAAGYAASQQAPIEIVCRAKHRGSRGGA